MSVLDNVSFSELASYFEENKDKDWKEWLSFETVFDKPGKQGIVGLLKTNKCMGDNNRIVFKISQYINYLTQHELTIMNGLNSLAGYCPHFCKSLGSITCKIDPKINKHSNPFDTRHAKHTIDKEVMLCEYIDKSYKFYNYIRSVDKISEDVLYSTVKQVLMALSVSQKKKKFTHYDLHSFNVMMKRCDKDTVFLYVLDDDNQFVCPTYGHYPIIIDFGFSYIEDMEDGPLWASLAHTDVGFMSNCFDKFSDPKLFLVTVSREIKDKRGSKRSKLLRRVVKNIFNPLTIDWDCGWDDEEEKGAADYVTAMVRDYNPGSFLFDEYEHYCIDILQSLVVLPLEPQKYTDIHKSYKAFLTEWMKVESQISSHFYNLYILKGIVDSARNVRAAYTRKDTRADAVKTFRHSLHDKVNQVADFCRLDGIQYETMLCSLIVFSRCMEGVMYDVISSRMSVKESEYRKMPLQNVEQIYAAIEVNLPDNYEYNKNTTVVVLNSDKEERTSFKLPSSCIKEVNELHSMSRGSYLYNVWKNIGSSTSA